MRLFIVLSSLITGVFLSGQQIDFEKDIKPIFEKHCLKCHGLEKNKGGLALHDKSHAFLESDSGELSIVAGEPQKSLLFLKLIEENEDERMPPKAPLAAAEIEKIKSWIKEGAIWPDNGSAKEVNWSLKPLLLPEIPKNEFANATNEIDQFVFAKLQEKKLTPAPFADPDTLMRRVHLDLTGLLPDDATLEEFKKSPTIHNYEKIVDKLLASESFGEKWAIQWLDLARYADSDGYQRDSFRDVYYYRDWVIKAINKDLPYDQFVIEQLAGDLLPDPNMDQLIATGFNRGTTINMEAGTDVNDDRLKQVLERVNVMGTVFLGSSIGCAQCHNHKYDPFSMKDYYRFMAYFNNTPIETEMVKGQRNIHYVGKDLTIPQTPEIIQKHKDAQAKKITLEKELILTVNNLEKLRGEKEEKSFDKLFKVYKKKYSNNKDLNKIEAELDDLEIVIKETEPESTRIMVELPEKRPTHIFLRGDLSSPGKQVECGVPGFLHSLPPGAPANRLGLAQWLVSPENPLLARAEVNRLWAEIFGRGLCRTLEDLGRQGDKPTHPELLDWLAVQLKNSWSRKKIIKLMVMSSTYRLSSVPTENLKNGDLANEYYGRMTPVRLKAELIRDVILQISGLLSTKMYGRPVKPPQPPNIWRVIGKVDNQYVPSVGEDRYRKGIYTIWRRSAHYASFAGFDAPDRTSCTVKRSSSNTPMQALTLLNDEVYVEAARAFAKKIENYSGTNREKIIQAFRLCTSRLPDAREVVFLEEILARPKEGSFGPWFNVATVLINLHETITRR